MKQLLIAALGLILLVHSSPSRALTGIQPFSAINIGVNLVTQGKIGPKACGPTALFYALKFGNEQMRAAYDKLRGESDDDKLKSLLDSYGHKPSKVKFHKYRYDVNDGTSPIDLMATANELLAGAAALQSDIFKRDDSEKNEGTLVKRIHSSLRNSLAMKVPVVAMLLPYVGTYVPSKDVSEWSEHNGHYVVVTSVPDKLDDEALGFTFRYLDPETGKSREGYIYEEVVRHFWARKDNPDGSADWIHPTVSRGDSEVTSPYLAVTAPGLALVPPNVKDAQRIVLALTTVIGRFSDTLIPRP